MLILGRFFFVFYSFLLRFTVRNGVYEPVDFTIDTFDNIHTGHVNTLKHVQDGKIQLDDGVHIFGSEVRQYFLQYCADLTHVAHLLWGL